MPTIAEIMQKKTEREIRKVKLILACGSVADALIEGIVLGAKSDGAWELADALQSASDTPTVNLE